MWCGRLRALTNPPRPITKSTSLISTTLFESHPLKILWLTNKKRRLVLHCWYPTSLSVSLSKVYRLSKSKKITPATAKSGRVLCVYTGK